MKRILMSMVLSAMLLAGGCQTITGGDPPVSAEQTQQAMERATQALIAAENGYTVAALSVAAAARAGLVPPESAPQIRRISSRATTALEAAHSARTAAERMRNVGLVEAAAELLRGFTTAPNPRVGDER